ncbi:Crp/Fnr family transcriptional regulator [Paenibacillus sp. sgz500958]|uniref:Crp/Fnr family transcriptional regulator n=1 Tax=Paenibacillus sp. sgz500958 TaxID=3242475 RepID=UPI0036D34528
MKCSCCELRSCVSRVPVFKGLSDSELAQIDAIIDSGNYSKGDLIFREGEESDSLFVLNNGLIKLTRTNQEGKEHIVRFLFPGDYFGQFSLFQKKQNYVNAEMIEDGTVCRLHRKDFLPLLHSNAALACNFLSSMSEQLYHAEDWAAAMHIMEADKRLAKILLYFHSKAPSAKRVILPASKKEIAAMIGTTAETFSRKLAQLEEMNLILLSKRAVNILDLEAIREMAGENK